VKEIPIEERLAQEVTHVQGADAEGRIVSIQVAPDGTGARNPAFDVTPAHLVTGLITERGVCRRAPRHWRRSSPNTAEADPSFPRSAATSGEAGGNPCSMDCVDLRARASWEGGTVRGT
jgi:hypothetical protein